MAFARGHAAFTIDTLKLAKDSLPAAVTEPPPVFPELLNRPHTLIESPANDYTLDLKLNFDKSFRALNDPSKANSDDGTGKKFLLTVWKDEWSLLPRELKQASRINIRKPNLSKKKVTTTTKKKTTTFNLDLNKYEERPANSDDEQENAGDEENNDIDENDVDDEEKGKEAGKKKLTETDNDVDGDIPEEEEDDDPFETVDYTSSYFDPGDGDDGDDDDDGGDGGD